jgi:hypothetical protein
MKTNPDFEIVIATNTGQASSPLVNAAATALLKQGAKYIAQVDGPRDDDGSYDIRMLGWRDRPVAAQVMAA